MCRKGILCEKFLGREEETQSNEQAGINDSGREEEVCHLWIGIKVLLWSQLWQVNQSEKIPSCYLWLIKYI